MVLLRFIELTPRLRTIAEQVPKGSRFADIGTDHARLPVWLLERGVIDAAIAADLREGPLDRARRTAARHAVTERISFRLGDGLKPLKPGESDVIAIAGMGGETIAAILSAAPWTMGERVTLLLQPMTSADALRKWLCEHGYQIAYERLVREDGTIYVVLTAKAGEMPPLTPGELLAGRQWKEMDEPLRGEYLHLLSVRTERALEGIRRSTRTGDKLRCKELQLLMTQLGGMEKEWSTWQQ